MYSCLQEVEKFFLLEWHKLMNGKKNERKGASLPTSTSSKPTSASSKQTSTSSKPKKQLICLKCGVTLARGGESYKKRHFSQSHSDLKESEALEFIVESNHQLAIARTKQKVDKKKISDNNKEQEVEEILEITSLEKTDRTAGECIIQSWISIHRIREYWRIFKQTRPLVEN